MDRQIRVIKSNQVIEASYQLTLIEQRVLLCAIAQIKKGEDVTDEKLYQVNPDQLKRLGTHETTVYRDLKRAVTKLYERSIHITTKTESIKTRWVQEIRFIENSSIIGIRFSKAVLPFISNLNQQFTAYSLLEISGMTSAHAVRCYELIVQYKTIGHREIFVSDLRKMLDLGTKYKLYADLKKRVIDVAVSQINEFSSFDVKYTELKSGRQVTAILFKFKRKQDNPSDAPIALSDKQIIKFAALLAHDDDCGNAFGGIGEERYAFEARLKLELSDSTKLETYYPYLIKHGFKVKN